MTSTVLYISLWDDRGYEACFPGYFRQAVHMDIKEGKAFNTNSISWPVTAHSSIGITTTMKLHSDQWGGAILSCKLSNPLPATLCNGDVINLPAGGVGGTLDGATSAILSREAESRLSFEEYVEKNPDATPRDVWEAAFVAGHRTAYTLLTGEAQ